MIVDKIIVLGIAFFIGSCDARGIKTRVFGGKNAEIKDYPYQVSLRSMNYHYCGGSIISERHVVTAAHCLVNIMALFGLKVHMGTGNTNVTGNAYKLVKVDVHPEYNGTYAAGYKHDIAVLTLNKPIVFNEFQQKINLPSKNVESGTKVNLTGWGLVSQKPDYRLEQLQSLETTIAANSDCNQRMSVPINDGQVCTLGGKGVGPCQGDSGGPLAANGELIGIVSWVDDADEDDNARCAHGAPELYTNVYAHKDFIEAAMQNEIPIVEDDEEDSSDDSDDSDFEIEHDSSGEFSDEFFKFEKN